jgi:hypothetical protein
MLATFPSLGLAWADLAARWLSLRAEQETAINLLLVPTWAPFLYGDVTMLTATMSIEAYHDASSLESRLRPKREFNEQVDRILAAVDAGAPDLTSWVDRILRSRNSKSFSTQLDEILRKSATTGEQILAVLPTFVADVNTARQQVAHPTHGDVGADGRFLYLSGAVRWILRHCLLADLGLDQAKVTELVSRCRLHRCSQVPCETRLRCLVLV